MSIHSRALRSVNLPSIRHDNSAHRQTRRHTRYVIGNQSFANEDTICALTYTPIGYAYAGDDAAIGAGEGDSLQTQLRGRKRNVSLYRIKRLHVIRSNAPRFEIAAINGRSLVC